MTTAIHISQIRSYRQAWIPGIVLALSVGLYVVVMPSLNLLPDQTPYNTKRIFEVALLLLAGVWLLCSAKARASWLQTFYGLPVPGRAALLVILALGVLSAALAAFPGWAFLEVTHLTLLFCLTVALAAFYQQSPEKAQHIFLIAIVLAVALYSARFLVDYLLSVLGLQYAFRGAPGAIWPNGELRSFVHIRLFNQFQTWTLPLIVLPGLLFASHGRVVRWMYSGLAMTWWMLLFGSGGRGTTLAVVLAGLVIAVAFRRRALPWLRAQGVALIGGALMYGLFFNVLTSTLPPNRGLMSDTGRFHFWERAWDLIQAHPLLGAGPMHYARYVSEWAAGPHNLVLQWASEWGAPAALLAVSLVAWGLVYCLRRSGTEDAPSEPLTSSSSTHVRVAVLTAVVAAAGHSLVSGLLIAPMSQMMLALIVGWCWGLYGPTPATVKKRVPGYRHAVLVLLVGTTGLWTAWSTIPEAFHQKEREAAFYEAGNSSGLRPRFWLQGYIEYPHSQTQPVSVAE